MKMEFSVPLAYRRHVQAALALALDEVCRDILAKTSGDPKRRTPIEYHMVDADLRGTVKVTLEHTGEAADYPVRNDVPVLPLQLVRS